jgi:hypothetical protein
MMRPEPRSERISRAVGQEVDRPMALQVHQQGALYTPTPHGPIVNLKDGGRRPRRIGQLADAPQQSIRAGGHAECGAQPRSGFTAERESKALQRRGRAHYALRRRPQQLGQAFSKGLSRTAGVQAAKAADVQDQTHGIIP